MSDDEKEKPPLKMILGKEQIEAINSVARMLRGFFANPKELNETLSLMAKIRKMKYDAHIAAGFTKEQALDIVKSANMIALF